MEYNLVQIGFTGSDEIELVEAVYYISLDQEIASKLKK